MASFSLKDIAAHCQGTYVGDDAVMIHSVATLSGASTGQISFLSNSKYRGQLSETKASAVLVSEKDAPHCPCAAIICQDPYVSFAKIAQLLDSTPVSASGVSPKADISSEAVIHPTAHIGPFAVIESGAEVGENVQIGAGCYIGAGVKLGNNTKLWANVTVYHGVEIGESCILHSQSVIGADGFGYANEKGRWIKIPQTGRVVIGNHVEIGASTTIDRGAIEDTVIEDGVIIDNQCQIAHNVRIKRGAALAGASVVAGSSTIGAFCTIGGLSAVNGHTELKDHTHYTGMSFINKSPDKPGLYSSGMPILPNNEWRRLTVNMRKLNTLYDRVKVLEKAKKEQD